MSGVGSVSTSVWLGEHAYACLGTRISETLTHSADESSANTLTAPKDHGNIDANAGARVFSESKGRKQRTQWQAL